MNSLLLPMLTLGQISLGLLLIFFVRDRISPARRAQPLSLETKAMWVSTAILSCAMLILTMWMQGAL